MAVAGMTPEPRPTLVNLSVRVTAPQGFWLDCMARRMGRSTGECLRVLLDEWMARDVHHRTQQALEPHISDKAR